MYKMGCTDVTIEMKTYLSSHEQWDTKWNLKQISKTKLNLFIILYRVKNIYITVLNINYLQEKRKNSLLTD